MKSAKYYLTIVALLLSLTLPTAAHAANPSGWWASSTGAKVHIGANQQNLVITIQAQNGQQYKYNGWWTRPGQYFSYQVPNYGVNNAAFANNNPNVIFVQSPNGQRTKWTRYTNSNAGNQYPASNNTHPMGSGNPVGWWKSTSGAKINIWADSQNLVLTYYSNGQQFKFNGWWVTYGHAFKYEVPRLGTAYCTFDQNNPNIIHARAPKGGVSTWHRQTNNNARQQPQPNNRPAHQRQSNSGGINGTWQSTSGSRIEVRSNSNQLNLKIIGANGAWLRGVGQWQTANRFSYSVAGYQGRAECNVHKNNWNKITCVFNGKKSIWKKY